MSEMTLPDGATLGQALRAARESAGKTVEDVSATTRIRTTLIRDLENDSFESSGAPVYARGHIRAIAHACGVDAEPYVELFSRQLGVQSPSAPVVEVPAARAPRVPTESLHVPTAARPERRGPNWVAAASAALAVLVVLFAIGQLTKPGSSGGPGVAASTAPTSRPAPSKAPTPTKAPLTAQRPPATGAELRVRLLGGDSWVSVRNATRTLFEGVLRNGAIQDFKDPKQLRLIVGNAGAVNIVCSGRDLAPAGGQGKVRRFTCNADGIVPA